MCVFDFRRLAPILSRNSSQIKARIPIVEVVLTSCKIRARIAAVLKMVIPDTGTGLLT